MPPPLRRGRPAPRRRLLQVSNPASSLGTTRSPLLPVPVSVGPLDPIRSPRPLVLGVVGPRAVAGWLLLVVSAVVGVQVVVSLLVGV
jgi:hypothetical protein